MNTFSGRAFLQAILFIFSFTAFAQTKPGRPAV
ncbi:MAG: hypothetical protein JWM28_1402, partial [Chitinophagaceae bacterium]|nr:hypothetical protein [Chitinophagaceae bacterium]